uniref:ATPase family AAA domain-containing protein FIGL1 n=1 Tax=Elaeis guineensis var. tenera TaxID=51953 RepID=A0A6I9RNC2_ELAGV|nr:ATPase family AAA domain-containing protein FIGL1 [Elaeis guineensis]XP_029122296.1 ATPase family AAA domain-containing protein FIGL1 [Elaeis guineensis]
MGERGGGGASMENNWRKEADDNLKRLHSLLFGADLALERGDPAAAHTLALRLLGFLHSRIHTPVDAAFVAPILAQASSMGAAASRALAPDSDCQAFEQARRDVGHVFVKRGDVDIEKIKQSKYFRSFLQNSIGSDVGQSINNVSSHGNLLALQGSANQETHQSIKSQPDRQHEKLSVGASKLMTQTKITSIYGSKDMKPNSISNKKLLNSEGSTPQECIDVDNECISNHNYRKSQGRPSYIQVEEAERPYGMTLKTKRRQTEFTSPICESAKSPSSNEEASVDNYGNGFVSARTILEMDARQRHGLTGPLNASISPQSDNNPSGNLRNYGMRYGASRRGLRGNFVPPIRSSGGNTGNMISSRISGKCDDTLEDSTRKCLEMLSGPDGELPEKLRNLEPRLIEHVSNEIMDKDPNVRWDDIAGLDHAKKCVTEMVIWPLLRPDIFRGCRSPGRGLLLFGPPGTGKTMIGKAIAGEAKATFFYISASSLTSKWIGEGEKLVRALFGVASCREPAVIFVDEIDSLLSQRKSEGEHESSRRLKTQFLIEMEGFDSGNEQILLIGATNRPQELDEAARRRLTKRLYIPLPSSEARAWIIRNLLEKDGLFKLSWEDTVAICKLTEGYSGSDMKNLVKEASMGPLREALRQGIEITKLSKEDMRPVTLQDFENALQEVRPSVSLNELGTYEEWNRQFGSLSI